MLFTLVLSRCSVCFEAVEVVVEFVTVVVDMRKLGTIAGSVGSSERAGAGSGRWINGDTGMWATSKKHGDDCRVGVGVGMMGTSLPFPAELAHLAV